MGRLQVLARWDSSPKLGKAERQASKAGKAVPWEVHWEQRSQGWLSSVRIGELAAGFAGRKPELHPRSFSGL